MESSGAGVAADLGSKVERIRYLVLRGISDLADADKATLEVSTDGAVRRLATLAPLLVMVVVLESAYAGVLGDSPSQ